MCNSGHWHNLHVFVNVCYNNYQVRKWIAVKSRRDKSLIYCNRNRFKFVLLIVVTPMVMQTRFGWTHYGLLCTHSGLLNQYVSPALSKIPKGLFFTQ